MNVASCASIASVGNNLLDFIFIKLQNRNQSRKMLKSKKSKSGRRKFSIKCFNADYAMPYDEGSRG